MCPGLSYSADLPKRLLAHRVAAGFSVRDLADRAGLNKGTISEWENAPQGRRFNLGKVTAVAGVLGISAEILLGAEDLPKDATAHLQLIRRVADLRPLLEQIPELQQLVEEARRISGQG